MSPNRETMIQPVQRGCNRMRAKLNPWLKKLTNTKAGLAFAD
jgi:hypothetical protein